MTQVALDTIDTITPAPNSIIPPIEATRPPAPAMVTVLLSRNYRPREDVDPADPKKTLPPVFEVKGYWKDEIKRKDTAGREIIVQKREFVPGEPKPPAQAGTGSPTKLLAGTVIKLRKDEAKYVKDNAIGTIEIDED